MYPFRFYTESAYMPAPIDPVTLQGVLRDLGVFPADLDALRRCPIEAGRQRLEELKELVRKNFKKLALQLHPDVTGGDPVKTERFKLVNTVKDDFEKLRLEIRPQQQRFPVPRPVPNMRVVRVVTWTAASAAYTTASASTTTTTTSTGFGIPFRVAVMRPT